MRYLTIIVLFIAQVAWAQHEGHDHHEGDEHEHGELNDEAHVMGVVLEETPEGDFLPLIAASVYWSGTTIGTLTNENGVFYLKHIDGEHTIIVRYVGYEKDSLSVKHNQRNLKVILKEGQLLDGVTVVANPGGIEIDLMNPLNHQIINEKELFKAACCNLSESFETNPSIDVSFADAVTGTRQIKMLGLAGRYTQITAENMPYVRGLASYYGMTYIPGTWIRNIQVTKGIGSVINGFESIAGQINVDFKHPDEKEKLYVNVYGNQEGRSELNVNLSKQLDKRWGTSLLMHGSVLPFRLDHNDDGFMDNPIGNQYAILNRWQYRNPNGIESQFGFSYLKLDKQGGQMGFNPKYDKGLTTNYGLENNTERKEVFGKLGYVFSQKVYKSVGLQLSASDYTQDSYFGLNEYSGHQKTLYANLIYQSIIGNTNHKFKTGASFIYDDYEEMVNTVDLSRQEKIPGAFFEYTMNPSHKFNLVAGMRTDYNDLYGEWYLTPRLHTRYEITEQTIVRATLGRGRRTANYIAENLSVLASSRTLNAAVNLLDPEIAWNMGVNMTREFDIRNQHGTVSVDFYRTSFEKQVILDLDASPQAANFYNLDGDSYSNSFQVEINYEPVRKLTTRLAYRYYDVKSTFGGELKEVPLISKHRAFLNVGYETKSEWMFDLTVNWNGSKRISNTMGNPVGLELLERSPDFFLINMQATKKFSDRLDVYVGIENLLNYKQDNPILAADNPFSPYFDSSLVWGPIFGRMTYAGLRYKIKAK